jgi:hypothetical protein
MEGGAMKNTICGIPITDEHAQCIRNTVDRIHELIRLDDERTNAWGYLRAFEYTKAHNPHNTFQGTAVEYIRQYDPVNTHYIKHIRGWI